MKILFRVDSSTQIGTGHLMRCLTLADVLQKKGSDVSFICRELPGNGCSFIEKKGYRVNRISYVGSDETMSKDAQATTAVLKQAGLVNWLIVDHYGLDFRWEERIRALCNKIMVIDDLADRRHDCDLLLDQNLYEAMEKRYDHLLPGTSAKLLGIQYALLRPEFAATRKLVVPRHGTVRRILVFFGGSDPTNETAKTLDAIRLLGRDDIAIDVVIGEAHPHKDEIRNACNRLKQVTFYCQVDNIAEIMAKADLSVGAVGSATWERFCLGLPTITIIIADNQQRLANDLCNQGLLICLGNYRTVTARMIKEQLSSLMSSPGQLINMQQATMGLVDGEGANRVAANIMNAS
jgi:UDP-2,4-diacetamido-2,4,6-trideoxy-beta-L-altropyranose hydrolase